MLAQASRGRQTNFSQSSHDGRHILQFGEMQLDVLAGRHMTNAGGIPLGKLGNAAQLVGRNPAEWNLDPHHLYAGLPLAVNAVLETKGFEEIADDLAGHHALRLWLKGFDLLENGRRNWLCLDWNEYGWS